MTAKQRATRDGFTLVEVLMVIAIIAVLAALLLTAINRVRGTAKVVQTTNDLTQVEAAIAKFKTDFNVVPPSHVMKPAAGGTMLPARFAMPVDLNSPEGQLLRRMFPRWNPATVPDGTGNPTSMIDFRPSATPPLPLEYTALVRLTNPQAQQPQPWSGGATNSTAPAPLPPDATGQPRTVPLDSNQLLVLLLAGPQAMFSKEAVDLLNANGGPTITVAGSSGGWDISGPYAPSSTSGAKKGPQYDFPQARLVSDPTTPLACPNGMPRYVDAWGTSYAYFTASAGDNYDPQIQFPWPTDLVPNGKYDPASDPLASSLFTAHPYRSNGKWLNPGRVQLISAGPDKQFGPGIQFDFSVTPRTLNDVWDARNPQAGASATYYGEVTRGTDDLSNFNGGSNLGTSNGS